jgi:hypothetical protein
LENEAVSVFILIFRSGFAGGILFGLEASDFSTLLELGLLESFWELFDMAGSIDIIYKYTESLVKDRNAGLVRLDTKSTVLIAFAGAVLKLAIDLDARSVVHLSSIDFKLSWLVYSFAGLTVLLAALGLTASGNIGVVDPRILMTDEWFDLDEDMHKGFIINTWIVALDEQTELARRKHLRLNLTVLSLCLALFVSIFIVVGCF